jgi:hypothetical protein
LQEVGDTAADGGEQVEVEEDGELPEELLWKKEEEEFKDALVRG